MYNNIQFQKFVDEVKERRRGMSECFYPFVSHEASRAFARIVSDSYSYEGLDIDFRFLSMRFDNYICETLCIDHNGPALAFHPSFIERILEYFFDREAQLFRVVDKEDQKKSNVWGTILDLEYKPLDIWESVELNIVGKDYLNDREILLVA